MSRVRPTLLLAALYVGASCCTPALAEGRVTAPAGAGKSEQQAVQWFNMLDRNGDGQLRRAEVQWAFRLDRRLEKKFDQADANRDGVVTEAEIRVLSDQRKAERAARKASKAPARAASAPVSRL